MTDMNADTGRDKESFWMRLFSAIVLLVLFALAEAVLWVLTILQLIWVPINGQKNAAIAEFGARLADWAGAAIAYLTGAEEARPFPWNDPVE